MALIDFPNAPTIGQQFLAPNAATYQWDGEVWTAPLIPTSGGGGSSNPIGPAGGDLSGAYPNPVVSKASAGLLVPHAAGVTTGAATPKTRLHDGSSVGVGELSWNVSALGVQDDPAQASWVVQLRSDVADRFLVARKAPGGANTFPLSVLANGRVAIGADPLNPLDVATKQYVDGLLAAAGLWTTDGTNLTPADPAQTVVAPARIAMHFGPGPRRGTVDAPDSQLSLASNHWWFCDETVGTMQLDLNAWGPNAAFSTRGPGEVAGSLHTIWTLSGDGNVSMVGTTLALAQRAYIESDSHALNLVSNSPGSPGYVSALKTWAAILDYENDHFDVQRDGTALFSVLGTGEVVLPTPSPGNAVRFGNRVAKGHLIAHPTTDSVYFTNNARIRSDASGIDQDDATKPSWSQLLSAASDIYSIQHLPAGGPLSSLLDLRGNGRLSLVLGPLEIDTSELTLGAITRIAKYGAMSVNYNWTGSAWARDQISKAAWLLQMDPDADQVTFTRDKGTAAALLTVRGDGRIRVTVDPANALDLATKQYVDAGVPLGGDLSGTLANAQLTAGVIVDADVNAAANIAGSKLLAKSVDGLRLTKGVYGRVYRTAALSLPNGVTTYLTFAGIAANYTASAGCSWSGAQPTRLTCAEAGIYAVGAGFSLAGAATVVHALIYKNAALILAGLTCVSPGYFNMFALAEMNANDFLEVTFLPNAAITIDSTYLTANLYAIRIA